MRQDEMVFLGMARPVQTEEEIKNGPLAIQAREAERRKQKQDDNMIIFDRAKQEIHDDIETIEGVDIVDEMLRERRDWIHEQKAKTGGKPPKELSKFYERNNLAEPLNPEEEAARLEEEAANKKGKKGKDKNKDKKGKGKKSDGDEEYSGEVVKLGPSECIGKFDEFYKDYNETWADRDET